jgi:hypothetical protein
VLQIDNEKKPEMPQDKDEVIKDAYNHAWNWFSLHAGQRMQSFNYFIVATAFLVAGYSSLLEKRPAIAVGTALMGAWIAFWFTRLDRRTRQLIDAGERVLEIVQARMAEISEIPEIKILDAVKQLPPGASFYSTIFATIEWTVGFGFLIAALYAFGVAACGAR